MVSAMAPDTPQTPPATRRDFVRAAALAAPARSAARVIGANDRINVGLIGVGIRGFYHLRNFVKQSDEARDIQVVGASDIFSVRKDRARNQARLEAAQIHHDYRDMLARADVDAVLIATPDHHHASMTLDALAAAKDVFLQKPMTYTIEEARQIAASVAQHKRVLQVGSQHLSNPLHRKAKELIEGGAIGDLLWGQATAARNSVWGEWNDRIEPEGTAETIDWNRWLGSAPKRPFSAERYFRWRKYWDYSGGIATDLFYHVLGPFVFAMSAGFPTRVTASGGIYVQKDREVPDTYSSTIEYPNFYINLSGSMANAAPGKFLPRAIYGHKGTITFEKDAVVVTPEQPELRGSRLRTPDWIGQPHPVDQVKDVDRAHTDDFFRSMRTRRQPSLNAELGYQVMVAIRMGVDAYRGSRPRFFDPKTGKTLDKAPPRAGYQGDGLNHES
jgi:predicted dehydrogenase